MGDSGRGVADRTAIPRGAARAVRVSRARGARAERNAMTEERLGEARQDARREAAPFGAVSVCALVALAALSRANDWELLGRNIWWLWLVVAAPLLALTFRFVVGLGHVKQESGRAFSL